MQAISTLDGYFVLDYPASLVFDLDVGETISDDLADTLVRWVERSGNYTMSREDARDELAALARARFAKP